MVHLAMDGLEDTDYRARETRPDAPELLDSAEDTCKEEARQKGNLEEDRRNEEEDGEEGHTVRRKRADCWR